MSAPKDPIKCQEWKDKIANSLRGKHLSENTKTKLSDSLKKSYAAGRKSPMLGKHTSDKQKEAAKQFNLTKRVYKKGYHLSEIHKNKISESLKSRKTNGILDYKKGKTYEEIFGEERAIELKRKRSIAMSGEKHFLYGKHPSTETLKKMSESRKGIKLTKEHVEAILKGREGYHHSEETKAKIALSLTGKKHSEETKLKIGNGNKGKIVSKETRLKLSKSKSGDKHPNWNKHFSEETKQKMSFSAKGKAKKRINCIYCGKSCTHSTVNRWHNENCKQKPITLL